MGGAGTRGGWGVEACGGIGGEWRPRGEGRGGGWREGVWGAGDDI